MIEERTPEGKQAFAEGYRHGWQWALDGIRRGLTLDEVQEACEALQGTLNATIASSRTEPS